MSIEQSLLAGSFSFTFCNANKTGCYEHKKLLCYSFC